MVRVVERIGQILAAFTVEHPALTLAQCATRVGLNKTTTYRLLQSLEEIGLVERDDSHWRLGPRVVTLATLRLGRFDLRHEAIKHLHELRRAFREAVAFSVPEGSDMIYLDRLDSPDAYGVNARLGSRAPMWAGGSGKAVLAQMDETSRQERLNVDGWRQLSRKLRETATKEIAAAATRGYCIDHGEFFNGIGGVAVAVTDGAGDPMAAISVIVPSDRLTDEYADTVGKRLLAVAAELEEAAGVRAWRGSASS